MPLYPDDPLYPAGRPPLLQGLAQPLRQGFLPQPQAAPVVAPSPTGRAQAPAIAALLATLGGAAGSVAPAAAPGVTLPASTPVSTGSGGGAAGAKGTVYVGDSLGVGTSPYLDQRLGRVFSNTVEGRSSASGVDALKQALGRHDNPKRIVFDLGTNDASASQLAQSLRRAKRLAGDIPIYALTVNGPDAAAKNRVLRRAGVTLIDWAARSGQYTGSDGIHATGAGYDARARMLAHRIRRS